MTYRNYKELRYIAGLQSGVLTWKILETVKIKTHEMCLAAFQQDCRAIIYIKKQTPDMCLTAVKQNGLLLRYVKRQTDEICLAAVQEDGIALEYVEDKTPEICLAAVKQNWKALEFVKEQTHEICLAAVQQNGMLLKDVSEQTPEICLAAVKQNWEALQYVKRQTPEICIQAIANNLFAFNYVNIVFDISPVIEKFDKKIMSHLHKYAITNKFIENMFLFNIDKPEIIKERLWWKHYDIELVKLLQEYNYVFSKDQILESIQRKVEIPHIHQYDYNLNSPEFRQAFKEHSFYPESYNIDM